MQVRVAGIEFMKFCSVERQLSHHTLQAYAGDLADFCRWLPADASVADVTEATLKSYLSDLIGRRKLTAATVRRRFACLRAFFRKLGDLHGPDPFASWRLRLPRRKKLPRSLSRFEVASLLVPLSGLESRPNATDELLPIAVRLMVSTGMRVGELCKLRVEDVSPDGASIRVHGKGSKDRIAYVSDLSLRQDLKRCVDQRRLFTKGQEALFLNRFGSPIRPQSVRSKLRRHASEVGLTRRITPHMLRHTAATLLIETGVDIRFVQRMLGHSSIATTEIYTHVSDEALRVTLERADILARLA